MLATFKETWKSIGDLSYGKQLIKRTVGESFWYWFKYPLTIAILILVLGVAAVTYFSPQVPRLAEKYIPEGEFSVIGGKADTTVKQPFVWEDSNFAFIVNIAGQEEDLDTYESGVLILEDRMIVKNPNDGLRTVKWSDVEDFTISKSLVVNGLDTNKLIILAIGLSIVLVLVVVGLGFYVLYQTVALLVGALGFFIVAKILKRALPYTDVLKLMYYAAVPAFLINLLNALMPNSLLPIVSMGVFVFLAANWIYRLPKVSK
jgi:hypothetical protein